IIGSTGETLVDQVEGKSYYGGFDVESLKKDILLGAAAGGFMNAFRRGTPKSKVEESAAFDMVENRDYIVDNLEQVDPETATEVKEQLDAAKENLDALKTHSNWDKLSEDEKAHAFALTQQAAALKEQEKIAAVQIEDKAKQDQIKAIEEELNTIFNEREEQTTTEEPQETTKIDGESEQQDLPTEGEATNEEVQPAEAQRVTEDERAKGMEAAIGEEVTTEAERVEGFKKAGEQSKSDKSPKALAKWLLTNSQTGDKIRVDDETYWLIERKKTKKGKDELILQQYYLDENGDYVVNKGKEGLKIIHNKEEGTELENIGYRMLLIFLNLLIEILMITLLLISQRTNQTNSRMIRKPNNKH
ncbi:MAG: hypothetical protein IPP69_17760, partial [Flavobacteriales bacterium]|nr:hypothetical protein [Flavobacteriales bacterium]